MKRKNPCHFSSSNPPTHPQNSTYASKISIDIHTLPREPSTQYPVKVRTIHWFYSITKIKQRYCNPLVLDVFFCWPPDPGPLIHRVHINIFFGLIYITILIMFMVLLKRNSQYLRIIDDKYTTYRLFESIRVCNFWHPVFHSIITGS